MLLTNKEARTILKDIKNLSSVKIYFFVRGNEEKNKNFAISYTELHKSIGISQAQLTTVLKELVENGLLKKEGKLYKSTHHYTDEESVNATLPLEVIEKMSIMEIINDVEWGDERSEYYNKVLKIVCEKVQENEAKVIEEVLEICKKYDISLYDGYMLLNKIHQTNSVSKEDFFNMIDTRIALGEIMNKILFEIEDTFEEVSIRIMKEWAYKINEYAKSEIAKLESGSNI